ncbi:hypothetical protein EJ03DRAFT_347468 [Teratosphaeria nubilosa]|uniref:Uncharacterized protein n=1 Tax=Teratosphaeria nubilosa TaxID=161662 RepID=A0A6G1LMK7_9PEZI|nr:hypothetical protein EJ03DRAFT_347468 [Teratosphaeria nubilosa]
MSTHHMQANHTIAYQNIVDGCCAYNGLQGAFISKTCLVALITGTVAFLGWWDTLKKGVAVRVGLVVFVFLAAVADLVLAGLAFRCSVGNPAPAQYGLLALSCLLVPVGLAKEIYKLYDLRREKKKLAADEEAAWGAMFLLLLDELPSEHIPLDSLPSSRSVSGSSAGSSSLGSIRRRWI